MFFEAIIQEKDKIMDSTLFCDAWYRKLYDKSSVGCIACLGSMALKEPGYRAILLFNSTITTF
jgi:hypothetical protein